jgi:transcriptional regulator with XRE-family HTH domain
MATMTIEGRNLARLRKAKGLSQFELAERCGIPKSTISRIETGALGLSPHKREIFAGVLEVANRDFYLEGDEAEDKRKDLVLGMLAQRYDQGSEEEKNSLAGQIFALLSKL